jgi:hypothetical protein
VLGFGGCAGRGNGENMCILLRYTARFVRGYSCQHILRPGRFLRPFDEAIQHSLEIGSRDIATAAQSPTYSVKGVVLGTRVHFDSRLTLHMTAILVTNLKDTRGAALK